MGTTETILLTIDINANLAKVVELKKTIADNNKAVTELTKNFDAGRISQEQYNSTLTAYTAQTRQAQKEVALHNRLVDAQVAANKAAAGSVDELKAKSALLTAQYNALGVEQKKSLAGEALATELGNVNKALTDAGVKVNDFRRNVGNYTGSIDPLIQQLIKLQEQQKLAAPDSRAYAEAQTKIIGFQQAVNEAGIKAGLTYEQTQAKLTNYGRAIQPATANLVKLEEEQKKLEAGSEAFNQIGFKVAKAAKEIEKVPTSAKSATESLKEAALGSGLFSDELARAQKFTGQFKAGLDVLKGGFKGVREGEEAATEGSKVLKIGLAEIGIGLLILAFTTLVSYFTQSAEGAKILKGVTSGLGAVFQVLTDVVTGVGKAIVTIFTDPKKAGEELLDFLKGQVINRLQSFGVILDGIKKGDFKQVTNGIIQFNTGVTNGIDKMQAFASKIGNAAKEGYNLVGAEKELIKSRRELEIQDVKEQSRVNVLLRLTKDRSKSAAEQLAALKEAGEIEARLTQANINQQQKELDLIKEKIALKGQGSKADLLQEKAEKEKQIAETLAAQDETNAKIRTRESVFVQKLAADRAEAAKKAAEEAQKVREDEIRARITATERALLAVREGSQQELDLKEQLVAQKAELEAAADKKTAAQRKLIVATSYVELLKLEDEFLQKREENAIKARDSGDAQRIAEANAEKKRLDDSAKDKEESYKRDEAFVERSLNRRRTEIEKSYADGLTDKKQYDSSIEILDEMSYGARIVLNKQYNKDTSKLEAEQSAKHRTEVVARREAEKKVTADRLKDAQAFGVEVGQLFVETLNDTGQSLQDFAGKVIILLLDSLEKAALAAQAQAILNAVPKGLPGIIEASLEAAAITVAFESAKAAISSGSAKPFNTGGIVGGNINGPNVDSQVPVLLTPGEVVITREAAQANLPLLSHLNSLYGGANFAPGFNLSRQASNPSYGGFVDRSVAAGVPLIDYDKLAAACAQTPVNFNYVTAGDAYASRQKKQDLFRLK